MSDGDSGSAADAKAQKTEQTQAGAPHTECPPAPARAIQDHAFRLQNACKRRFGRRV